MAAGTIIAGLLSLFSSVATTSAQSSETDAANAENRMLAGQTRADTIETNRLNSKQNAEQFNKTYGLKVRQQSFNEGQTNYANKKAQELEDYGKQQTAWKRAQDQLNAQLSQDANMRAIFRGRVK